MLRNSKNMLVAREGDIQSHTLGTPGLGVRVSTKALIPPSAFIFLGLLLALAFDLYLRAPMLHVKVALVVQLNVGLAIPLEVGAKGGVADDSLELVVRTVQDSGKARLGFRSQGRGFAQLQATNQHPFLCLIVAFLACFAIVSKLDVTVHALFLIDNNSGGAGLEEGDNERQLDFLVGGDGLENGSVQLAILELDGG